MAAFSFFRRRQKMVLWIMVILMVAFLVPTGIRGLSEHNSLKDVIGSAGEAKITLADLRDAQSSLQFYRNMGLAQYMPPLRMFYMVGGGAESEAALHWALLVLEAKSMGMAPNKAQLDQFLTSLDLSGGKLRSVVARMGSGSGLTEDMARQHLADLLAVLQTYGNNVVYTWPSLPQLLHTYVAIREKIQVAMVDVPAQKYVSQVGEPSNEDVEAWFKLYRNFLPDDPSNKTEFGFGYSLPNRARVQYLFVNTKAVEEAVEPSPEQMRDYWLRYKGQITIKVPASAPATAAAGTQPAEFADVPAEKFSQAQGVIRQTLKAQMAEAKTSELIARVRELSDRFNKEPNPYAKAVEAMVQPAANLLNTKVEGLAAGGTTLSQLVAQLSELTKVRIVYPLGKHGDITLDGQLKVQINPKWNGKTLGAVLDEVATAIKSPAMRWVTCEGLGNTIFTGEPVNMVPVRAGDSGLVPLTKLADEPLLAGASTSKEATPRGADTLPDVVAAAFGPESDKVRAIKEGEEFRQAMYLSGADEGRLLWRLAGMSRLESPNALTDELRAQVVRDWKIQQAFNKAYDAAKEMARQVDGGASLEALAKAQGLAYDKSAMLTQQDALTMDPALVSKAFDLFPADPDHPGPRPAVAVAPLYRQQKAAVLQRLAFEPAVKGELSGELLTALGEQIVLERSQRAMYGWFNGDEIARRMVFVPKAR